MNAAASAQELSPAIDYRILKAEVEVLKMRMRLGEEARWQEAHRLLDHALEIGADSLEGGRCCYAKAKAIFDARMARDLRFRFLQGAFAGTLVGYVVIMCLLALASYNGNIATHLAAPATIWAITFFALIGSLTSIFVRLGSLVFDSDLGESYVFTSGFIQPLLALGFVSVVYIILNNKLLGVGFVPDENRMAGILVAAFLCGFSERFAPVLLAGAEHSLGKKA